MRISKPYLISNFITIFIKGFISNSFCKWNACQSSWLRTCNFIETSRKKILWNLNRKRTYVHSINFNSPLPHQVIQSLSQFNNNNNKMLTWVDFPQPVSPATITTWKLLAAWMICSLYWYIGRFSWSFLSFASFPNCKEPQLIKKTA